MDDRASASSAVCMSVTGCSSSYSMLHVFRCVLGRGAVRRRLRRPPRLASTQIAARACCGADFRPFRCDSTPIHGVQTVASSWPVTTAYGPAWRERRRGRCCGCARGHRASARRRRGKRGSIRSLTKAPRPWSRLPRLGRGTVRPIYLLAVERAKPPAGRSWTPFFLELCAASPARTYASTASTMA